MLKKWGMILLCLLFAAGSLAGCGGGANAQESAAAGENPGDVSAAVAKTSFVIGLSQEGLDHSYMIVQRDQILAAAEAYTDAEVKVICTDGQNSTSTQVKGIEDMLIQQIDLLMVQAAEGEGLKSALAKAEEQGVPYMFVGKPVLGTNAVTMVNNDNYEIGKAAAEWTVQHLVDKNGSETGNVVIVAGIPGDQSAEDRVQGYVDVISQYDGIQVIANIPANYRRAEALKVTQDILQANPVGTIDCLYGCNGETSIGAAQAVADAGRKGEFPVLSVDGDEATLESIKSGDITAAWTYEPCGEYGFAYAMKVLNGEDVDPEVIIDTRMIDAANVDTAQPAF